jgi:predicted RNase H-like HicB family nuclease
MKDQNVHAVVFKDAGSDQWVAICLEYDIVTQGDNEEHAKAMLKEAIELHIEEMTAAEREALYQPIEGEPKVHMISVDVSSVLHT